jgi:hypothetical protein
MSLGHTQPRIQWVPGALSLEVMRPGREADHSPPSNAEVKECVKLYLHSPNTPSWCGAQSTGTTLSLPSFYIFIYIMLESVFKICVPNNSCFQVGMINLIFDDSG